MSGKVHHERAPSYSRSLTVPGIAWVSSKCTRSWRRHALRTVADTKPPQTSRHLGDSGDHASEVSKAGVLILVTNPETTLHVSHCISPGRPAGFKKRVSCRQPRQKSASHFSTKASNHKQDLHAKDCKNHLHNPLSLSLFSAEDLEPVTFLGDVLPGIGRRLVHEGQKRVQYLLNCGNLNCRQTGQKPVRKIHQMRGSGSLQVYFEQHAECR